MRAEPAADALFDAPVWVVWVREGVLLEGGDWWTSAEVIDEEAPGLDWRVLRDVGAVGGPGGCAGRCRSVCRGFVWFCWARRSVTGTWVSGCCIQRSIWGVYGIGGETERVVDTDMVMGGPGGAGSSAEGATLFGSRIAALLDDLLSMLEDSRDMGLPLRLCDV